MKYPKITMTTTIQKVTLKLRMDHPYLNELPWNLNTNACIMSGRVMAYLLSDQGIEGVKAKAQSCATSIMVAMDAIICLFRENGVKRRSISGNFQWRGMLTYYLHSGGGDDLLHWNPDLSP